MPARPDPLDHLIGANIRRFRLEAHMSQATLADAIGVSFQQLQKYEKGRDRIAASRLFRVSEALDQPVQAFFDAAAPVPLARRSGGP